MHKVALLLQKLLNKRNYSNEIFTYDFSSVYWNGKYFIFETNVTLPKRNWSFYVPDIKQRVLEIISNLISNSLGGKHALTLKLSINGEKTYPEVFINKSFQNQILFNVNQQFSTLTVENFSIHTTYEFQDRRYQSRIGDDGFDFNFDIHLSNPTYKGVDVIIPENNFDIVFSWLYDRYLEGFGVNLDVADLCYAVVNDEVDLLSDSYVGSNTFFQTYEGKDLENYLLYGGGKIDDEYLKSILSPKNGSKF